MNYFSEGLTLNHIPNFLKAQTPEGLRRLILKTNHKYKGFVNYSTPQFVEKDNAWYVWYYIEVKVEEQLDEVLNG